METVGLSVAIITLYKTVVGCVICVDGLRNYKRDRDTCLFRLQNAQLRVSRWGEAAGVLGMADKEGYETAKRRLRVNDEDFKRAHHLLEHISRLFADAEKQSGSVVKLQSGAAEENPGQ